MRGAAAAAGPARPTEEVRPPAIATVISDVTTPHFGKLTSVPEERPAALKKKRVSVTVTVLSVAGLFVKDGAPKKKGIIKKFPSRGRSLSRSSRSSKAEESRDGDSSTQTASTSKDTAEIKSSEDPPTTIVASFSRAVPTREGKSRTVLAHVPSLPLPLLASDNGSSGGKTLDSVVHWPGPNTARANNGGKILSSYQFQHTFQQEEHTAGANALDGHDNEPSTRYAPQPLDIQVAISRSGRLFKLGTARLFLSGEENGERSRNVPIMNCNPAVPKSGKHSKWLNNGSKETVIPMMKLKGDTLKCGLDPDATLRVMVRVSEPIGETVEVSPTVTVTMISHSDRLKQQEEEELRRQRESYRRQDALAGDTPSANGEEAAYPQEICWEYNPALAAVVAKDPKKEGRDDSSNESEGPLVRVLSLQDGDTRDGEEDGAHEHSCTSSAYMSAHENGSRRHNHSVPTKGRSELTGVHSANTRTTATGSTLISDLTDGRSWLSQTGIEVIPFAPAATAPNAGRRPARAGGRRPARSGSKLRSDGSIAGDSLTTGASLLDKEVEEQEATAQFPRATAKKPGWRQRLTCGMPLCGAAGVNAGDHLLAVHEEEDAVVTNKRWGLIGRCANGNLSEDDGSSVDDNSSDEESNLCADDY